MISAIHQAETRESPLPQNSRRATIQPPPTSPPRQPHFLEENDTDIFQKTTAIARKPRISRTKGHLSKRTAFVREIVKEVAGLAPYERRVIELLRNSKDKRARKLAKKRVCRFLLLLPCLCAVVGYLGDLGCFLPMWGGWVYAGCWAYGRGICPSFRG